jgi:hypothetical protein
MVSGPLWRRHGGPPTAVTTFQSPRICFTAAAPNRIWLADITYVETDQGWLYLPTRHGSVQPQDRGLGDGRSFAVGGIEDGHLSATTCPRLDPRFRSGLQYASAEYRKAMQSGGFKASMSRKCDCYEIIDPYPPPSFDELPTFGERSQPTGRVGTVTVFPTASLRLPAAA